MAKKRKRFLARMQKKLFVVMIIITLAFGALVARILYIDAKNGKRYEKIVLAQQSYDSIEIPYRRGDILDRNGTQLATSEKVYNLIIEPKNIQRSEEIQTDTVAALKKYFDIKDEEINEALQDSSSLYKKLRKKMTYEQIKPFQEFMETKDAKNVKGIWFEDEYERYYPYDSLACHAIGFTVSGNVGQGGIEGYYSKELNGINGREYGYLTQDMTLERTTKSPINGYNVISTIDANAQNIVEKKIDAFMSETGAKNVSVLVMDPNSGEVLAMANSNKYNLNEPYEDSAFSKMLDAKDISYLLNDREVKAYFTPPKDQELSEEKVTYKAILEDPNRSVDEKIKEMPEEFRLLCMNKAWRNFIVSDGFEPGSTYKTFTIAGAMEDSVLKGDESFFCGGMLKVADYDIKCHNHQGHGQVNIEQALMQSCNVALMEIVQAEGRSTFSKYQDVFGFGKTTHVDLPGEAGGLIYEEDKLNPVELATSSFGQGLTVTMMQIGTAFCSVINGGNYYEPHMVKQIVDENGGIINNIEPTILRKTLSADTSTFMREALFQVVENGTAKKAKVEGYTIGGKTGTAEKLPRGNGKYLLSFIGFAPVENPQLVVYVTVDEPNVADQASSGLGTIIAQSVFEELLPYMNIYQSDAVSNASGEDTVGDEVAGPIFEGSIPEEQISQDLDASQDTEQSNEDTVSTEGEPSSPEDGSQQTGEDLNPPAEGAQE
ncbi:MAG: penicillin-binding transpeptidase domain-containing protein [Eubacteriales bacterium]|nr:penicillin-binding transpeptidase domain-containing protein [Eubacteriales bacterium]